MNTDIEVLKLQKMSSQKNNISWEIVIWKKSDGYDWWQGIWWKISYKLKWWRKSDWRYRSLETGENEFAEKYRQYWKIILWKKLDGYEWWQVIWWKISDK